MRVYFPSSGLSLDTTPTTNCDDDVIMAGCLERIADGMCFLRSKLALELQGK